MDVTNLVANVAGPSNSATTVTAPVSNNGVNGNNGKILSDSQAMALKRSDVIVEILKELVRTGVPHINFVDLIIDYIACGEFRYSSRNEIIRKFFIGEEMLTENEMEDYVVFRSLEKLYEQRPTRNDLKLRLDNLKSGEAFICMFEAFANVIKERTLFGFTFHKIPDLATKSVIMILTVPSKDLTPDFATSRLKEIGEVRQANATRNLKRKETMELKKTMAAVEKEVEVVDAPLVNKRRKVAHVETPASSSKTKNQQQQLTEVADVATEWEKLPLARKNMYYGVVAKKSVNAVRCQIARLRTKSKIREANLLQHALDLSRGKQRL